MRLSILRRAFAVTAAVAVLGATAVAPVAAAQGGLHRFMIVAKSAADFDPLVADVQAAGGRVVSQTRGVNMIVAVGTDNLRTLSSNRHAVGVAYDHVEKVAPPDGTTSSTLTPPVHRGGATTQARAATTSDPANALAGLMWNMDRIGASRAWSMWNGSPTVTVGVADTGLDYTHSELASRVVGVQDFTLTEDPNICSTFVSDFTDQDLADFYHAPANVDWNGHGSWIGGTIAAALDGAGINGIAPNVNLFALKISQWCGSAYDSEILDAFTYAADHGIDIVSISFGGYLNRANPDENLIYNQYVATVAYAASKGTVIVASSGNEHVRVGAGGRVLSHGSETLPGDALSDLFGLYETPGGIPGVVDVSATGNVVAAPSASCPEGTDGTGENADPATCKPLSDAHQPTGVGKLNQLAYYSNYGPRIDVAAPGGARKFNVPNYDRGGTPGYPFTDADGTTAFQTFSITSNFALEIPCFFGGDINEDLEAEVFYPDDCYSTIQGTSMATPHVSAVLALIASKYPQVQHRPVALIARLKQVASQIRGNTTQPLAATDFSPGDLTGVPCVTGYCHNGGPAIPDAEAYGAGLIDAFRALQSR